MYTYKHRYVYIYIYIYTHIVIYSYVYAHIQSHVDKQQEVIKSIVSCRNPLLHTIVGAPGKHGVTVDSYTTLYYTILY